VSLAFYSGAKSVVCASTGNTAASAAAYAARAGMEANIVLPKGAVARGKIAQAIAYGARIFWVDGPFDVAMRLVMEAASKSSSLYPLNSFNPWRLEGQKTIVFEVVEELKHVDAIFYPVGNGGNIAAAGKALKELADVGVLDEMPKLVGVQAAGAAPLADALERGLSEPVPYEKPATVASAIRIGNPVNWPKALRAIKLTKGTVLKVSDEEILKAQKELARSEGLLVEPASAAAYAGYLKALERGVVERSDVVAVILTGSGLKDPDSVQSMEPVAEVIVDATVEALLKAMGVEEPLTPPT